MSSDPWTSHGVNSAIPMLCGASAGVVEPAGGSQDNNAARLVSKGRTPTGAFFIGARFRSTLSVCSVVIEEYWYFST